MEKYEWAVVGSGIAGVITSEILTREGHSVILIEKNDKLASETTRDFHEWMHLGSLFTLIPDNLRTLKFILGAVDDLFDFYSSYKRMNLIDKEHVTRFFYRNKKKFKIKNFKNIWKIFKIKFAIDTKKDLANLVQFIKNKNIATFTIFKK